MNVSPRLLVSALPCGRLSLSGASACSASRSVLNVVSAPFGPLVPEVC
jgi:hypothetical protein